MKRRMATAAIAVAVLATVASSCTERRRASDPVVADGDTIEVVIGAQETSEPTPDAPSYEIIEIEESADAAPQ
ncbi:MAG: hypothetical protein J1E97_04610 [Muribaculaceae bacterium]|nr:hypothetical protein [Muribaculaceae bacterium]